MRRQASDFWLRGLFILLLVLGAAMGAAHSVAQSPGTGPAAGGEIHVLTLDGAVGPASADYLVKNIDRASQTGAALVIIRMDTPGGLDTSMREIIRAIVNSPVPVVTYVAPGGARAASAGAFILTASHIAAMAPATSVGAASPVQLGGSGGGGEERSTPEGSPAGLSPANASEAKAMNDAIAYIRGLAEMRGRNADWAEAAVREAASLSATDALQANVIEIVARDMTDLLAQLDGRSVTIGESSQTVRTTGMQLVEVEPNWRTQLLMVITNPNIALILMAIGAYGLLFEFMNPGALYPGTIGAVALLLGLYALTALPVNYAGMALIVLGLALMVAEGFSPSFGVLGIVGVIAFIFGATILFDTEVPEFRVALPLLAAVAISSLGMTMLTVRLALKSRQGKIVSGREEMIGSRGKVLDWAAGHGHVHVHGERWRASGPQELQAGQAVEVTGLTGLTITVHPAEPSHLAGQNDAIRKGSPT